MSVTILPMPNEPRLCVVGDVEAQLAIPAALPCTIGGRECVDAYLISLSDGSLIRAVFHECPRFEVIVEGAGIVRIDKAGRSITVDWSIEWIALSSDHASIAVASKPPPGLPLFEHMRVAA